VTGSDDQGAVSLRFARDTEIPTLRAAYSDRAAAMMAAFCQNAYLPFDVPPKRRRGDRAVTTDSGTAELSTALSDGDFRLVAVFNHADVQAYLAIRDDDFAVLAFRGTTSLRDWAVDLNAGLRGRTAFKGVRLHSGFWSAFAGARTEIETALAAHVPSDMPLYLTGHSLGGALALIAAAALERDNLAACYTFGCPRVATRDFDTDVKCPHYRVVNNWDLVPGVPANFLGYSHSGDPRLLTLRRGMIEILRRDRSPLARFFVNVFSIATVFIYRRWLVIDDHMIWNYRHRLEQVAVARNAEKKSMTDWRVRLPNAMDKPAGRR